MLFRSEEFDDFDDIFGEEAAEDDISLAQEALDRGDNSTALELAEEYLEDHPFDFDALNLCAVAAANLNDTGKALVIYQRALRLDPKNGALHHNYGVLLQRLGSNHEAIKHFRRSIDFQPDFPEAYINLGNSLDEEGKIEEALHCYDEALRRLPDASDAYYNRGFALNRQIGRASCWVRVSIDV